MLGQKFGRLVPIEMVQSRPAKWKCLCDCGETAVIWQSSLKYKRTQSCGCLKRERTRAANSKDLSGQKFGSLTAVRPTSERYFESIVWECTCDCGNQAKVSTNFLTTGHTKSCGCRKESLGGFSKTKEYKNALKQARKRRVRQQMPRWASASQIREFYQNCPDGHQVDHVIPIKSQFVCGLHVIENLQYLPAHDNHKKSNKFTGEHSINGQFYQG